MEFFKNRIFGFLTALLLFSFSFLNGRKDYFEDLVQLKGFITTNKETKKMPQFSVYYAGVQTVSDEAGVFTLVVSRYQIANLALLVCKDFKPRFQKSVVKIESDCKCKKIKKDSNTVLGQFIDRKKPYVYLVQTANMWGQPCWQFQKLLTDKIPDNCVIIRMNPKIISSVENWQGPFSNKFQRFVKITLKSTVTDQKTSKSEYKSLLGTAIDVKKFYEPTKRVERKAVGKNLVKVSQVVA
ncbi:TPA: hypothetical protein DEO28_04320 [Candidatus Dependentiae bacterium]|nr:MAG: hypothetical protein UR14_C0006G0101 [candidate division TM6 bacterium GW2011_GWE2_31_21]KKP53476.1 MAG: hypothetical protein UR43_C0004G0017 [candidate division TM6 bacterium GW2011_GWF2_33_332]HBS48282.1 hypothetical protein [Candidatus Dependentiae bacterium]HBZ73709.1 hypothetical protein [Candidatus Dependentiae bacterium]